MKHFLLIYEYVPDYLEKRRALRPAHFVLARATDQGTELWVGDAQSGALKPVPGLRLNLVLGSERSWLSPGELVVLAVPAKRGAPPATPKSPVGPVVQESMGRASPDRTYPDLLKSAHDEALFDHFTRSQPVKVRMSDLATQVVGPVGQYTNLTTLGQGHHLMTERLQRPYSYTLPVEDFLASLQVLVDLDRDWVDVLDQLTTCRHTRVPCYHGTLDHIAGVLHLRNLTRLLRQSRRSRQCRCLSRPRKRRSPPGRPRRCRPCPSPLPRPPPWTQSA